MSVQSQAPPALSPSQRYLAGILLRLRRLINQSVASMLANREKAAMQFAKGCGGTTASGDGTVRDTLHDQRICISSNSFNSRR
ncbi:hypothetical protein ABH991_006729 [Bradyrhizobium ottawaense]|jgi:hypothetical protein|uniref:Uncharacterized protein n=1 Tax=Bradyrhizobium ottawaense TaxID=931866 RepID=A0A2U8PJ45_9BRAD|nr:MULTISPECIES: hypothetical protein [Bradyrhizobium]MDA9414345.1 hypothetical protein [Bradyrhizobium sp. CCBAU 25360]MDA9481440.1 hypothetical protein [Bradyrhizobium sp. CCBAU 11445]BBO14098.1 hypothetical protein TM102_55680 [Bradyrhizobium sp. TM102]AWL97534.1 hypothetical protein CIT37_39460 [Bradyrhizobium ottawaense]PDT65397.1 hypothetical protein CO683_33280 [Bradyrhizobium ottawaense]